MLLPWSIPAWTSDSTLPGGHSGSSCCGQLSGFGGMTVLALMPAGAVPRVTPDSPQAEPTARPRTRLAILPQHGHGGEFNADRLPGTLAGITHLARLLDRTFLPDAQVRREAGGVADRSSTRHLATTV